VVVTVYFLKELFSDDIEIPKTDNKPEIVYLIAKHVPEELVNEKLKDLKSFI